MATAEEILDSAGGGSPSPAAADPVEAVLASVPPQAGSFAPAAEALGASMHEGHLGDPVLNGEHIVGHVGLRDLLAEKFSDKIVRAAEKAESPELAGVAGLGHVEKAVNSHSGSMEKNAKSVLEEKGDAPEEATLSADDHKELVEQLHTLAGNPMALIDGLTAATHALHAVAPQTAQSTQQTATRAINFLASKTSQPDPDPLSTPYEASDTERATFNRYLSIVENPSRALLEVKHGTLIPETVETLQTVFPKLYDQMKQSLISSITPELPFQKRMMVSQFLGEPMDSSLTPARMMSIQKSFLPKARPEGPAVSGGAPKKSLSKLDVADRTSLNTRDDE